MKRIGFVMTVLFLALFSVQCATAGGVKDPGIQSRINELQKRIDNGIVTGELTRPEAVRVQRELDRIREKRAGFKADGYLGPREREILHHDLDLLEKMIYRLKHNPRRR